jgi:hypothetical protein
MSSEQNASATSADSLSKARSVPQSETKMRDVAAAAGVSVATVSNVLNKPHLVAAKTKARVEQAIHELGFQPDQHARELRSRRRTDAKDPQKSLNQYKTNCQQRSPAEDKATPSPDQKTYCGGVRTKQGDHLTVQVGPELLSGTVDAVMPDNSYFWIWADNGMGRRLVEAADAVPVDLL